jgi:hypothetical protein
VGFAVAVLLLGFSGPLLDVQSSGGREHADSVLDGVIFKSPRDVYVSDAEGVVVTDVSWQPIEEELRRLQKYFGDMITGLER